MLFPTALVVLAAVFVVVAGGWSVLCSANGRY